MAIFFIILFAIWLIGAGVTHHRLFSEFVRTGQAKSLHDFSVWKQDDGVLIVTIMWPVFLIVDWL